MKLEFEKFEKQNKCPVCLNSSLNSYRKSTFDFFHLNEEQIKITDSHYGNIWELSQCQNCTHVFANPCPTPEFIRSLYAAIEDPLYEEEAQGRSKNFLRILSFLERIQPAKGTLFDVGAATGVLLNLAFERKWKSEGIEASSWAVKLAEEKYHLRLYEGFFETAHLKNNFYQAVTMVDFIEHIPKPLQALAKAYEILAPSGILCLVTPDINSLAARFMGRKWWHFRPAHLAYFTLKSLSMLFSVTGFKILSKRKYSWTFSAHYLISRVNQFKFLLNNPYLASFLKRIPVKLAFGDSIEVYVRKEDKC